MLRAAWKVFLTVHGVHREQPAFQLQRLDHGLRGGDFVAFAIHFQMAQDQRVIHREGAQNMRRPLVVESIKTVPERLACAFRANPATENGLIRPRKSAVSGH